jgi:S1-C subfamily serine protease
LGRERGDRIGMLLAATAGALASAVVLAGAAAVAGVGSGGSPSGEDAVRAVYRAAAPAVVSIDAGDRTGSGFLVDDAGHVVTNAHVVGDAQKVEVSVGGRRVSAHPRGVERSVDIAVLQLDGPAGDATPLAFAADEPRMGDPVVANGSPFGLQGSLSTGIVSGLRRQIDSPNGFAITGTIQTDAALNPGNSGGPLLDMSGRVVGVATQIATESGRNEGIGFAVPAPVAHLTVDRIIATGSADLPYLGIMGQNTPDGILLAQVFADGPAAGTLAPGDLITGLDGDDVTSNADLARALADAVPGQEVTVSLTRDGDARETRITLTARPAGGPEAP